MIERKPAIKPIRFSKDHSIQYRNGYWEIRKFSIMGENSKTPGAESKGEKKTYPSVLSVRDKLVSLGENGNEVMIAIDKLLNLHGVVSLTETKKRQLK